MQEAQKAVNVNMQKAFKMQNNNETIVLHNYSKQTYNITMWTALVLILLIISTVTFNLPFFLVKSCNIIALLITGYVTYHLYKETRLVLKQLPNFNRSMIYMSYAFCCVLLILFLYLLGVCLGY